jgi:DNA-binding NtrC family response regulator
MTKKHDLQERTAMPSNDKPAEHLSPDLWPHPRAECKAAALVFQEAIQKEVEHLLAHFALNYPKTDLVALGTHIANTVVKDLGDTIQAALLLVRMGAFDKGQTPPTSEEVIAHITRALENQMPPEEQPSSVTPKKGPRFDA